MQVSDTVYPMYKAFIEPDLAMAHIRIHNSFNPFHGFMDATYILKSDKCPSGSEIEEMLEVWESSLAVPVGNHDCKFSSLATCLIE